MTSTLTRTKPLKAKHGCTSKRYATLNDAANAARSLTKHRKGTYEPFERKCGWCGGFHVLHRKDAPEKAATGRVTTLVPKPAARPHPFPTAVTALLDARDISLLDMERCCQMCAAIQYLEHHHRRLKGMGGSENRDHAQCTCNGILLCRRCHRWAHTTGRLHAEAMGFVVSRAEDEPGKWGVMRFAAIDGGSTQWPDCHGNWCGTAPEAREAA